MDSNQQPGLTRSQSAIDVRQMFPPPLSESNKEMEEELEKIRNTLIVSDRRNVGSLLGASLLGLLGFVLFSGTLVFAFVGGAAGFALGRFIGWRLKARKKAAEPLNENQMYQLRLVCLLIYLKQNKRKGSNNIDTLSEIIVRVVEELRPAFALQLHDKVLQSTLTEFRKILRTDVCHTAILNKTVELELLIKQNTHNCVISNRIRRFFIPVMFLLKKPGNTAQYEFVNRLEQIMNYREVRNIMKTYSCQVDEEIENIADITGENFRSITKTECYKSNKAVSDLCNKIESSVMDKREQESQSRRKSVTKDFLLKRTSTSIDIEIEPDPAPFSLINAIMKLVVENHEPVKAENSYNRRRNSRLVSAMYDPMSESEQEGQAPSPSPRAHKLLDSLEFKSIGGFNHRNSRLQADEWIFRGNIEEIKDEEEDDDDNEVEEEADLKSRASQSQVMIEMSGRQSSSGEELIASPENHTYFPAFKEIVTLEAEESSGKSWKVINNTPTLKVFCKRTKDSPVLMVKAYCIIEHSVETVFTCIADCVIRKSWDKVFDEFKTVEEGDDFEVLYYSIKTPFGITKRDFLQRRTHIMDYPEKDSITMHFTSIEHPLMPVRRKVVRAITQISGYVIRPISNNKCSLTIISQNDVKGLIPKFIVNKFSGKAPKQWVKNLIKGCDTYTKDVRSGKIKASKLL